MRRRHRLVLNLISRDRSVPAVWGVAAIPVGIMAIVWPGISTLSPLCLGAILAIAFRDASLGLANRLHGVACAHQVPASAS
jgi:hypothetical protein